MVGTRTFVSLVASLAACSTALLVYSPVLGDKPSPAAFIAVLMAAAMVRPLLSQTAQEVKRLIIAALLSAPLGVLFVWFGQSWRLGTLICSFPIILFFAYCEPSCRTPLQRHIWTPIAMINFYQIVVFGPEDVSVSLELTYQLVLVEIVGGLFAMVWHLFLTLIFQRHESFNVVLVERSLQECAQALLHVAEGAMAYHTSGTAHDTEVEFRLKTLSSKLSQLEIAVMNWQLEPWSDKPSPEAMASVLALFTTASAQQWALHRTFGEGYSAETQAMFWHPLIKKIEHVRLSTISTLRAICKFTLRDAVDKETIQRLVEESKRASDDFKLHAQQQAIAAGGSSETGPESEEVLRAFFAMLSFQKFPLLLGDLHTSLRDVDIASLASSWRPRFFHNVASAFVQHMKILCTASAYFKASPADAILEGGADVPFFVRARRLSRFPCRFALIAHVTAISLFLVNPYLRDEIASHLFWVLLPCCLCVLPTTGAVLWKSTHRFLGNAVGGLISLPCLWWNPSNWQAIILECFIVVFIGTYGSINPNIGYSGIMVYFAWVIVVFGVWQSEVTDLAAMFEVALWRIAFTFFGCVLAILGSILLIPRHATKIFEQETSEDILCITDLAMLSMSCVQPHRETAGGKSAESNATAHKLETMVRARMEQRRAVLDEAEKERWLIRRRVPDLAALQRVCTDLVRIAASSSSIGLIEGQFENEAAYIFVSNATENGPQLKHDIVKLQEMLHAEALRFALLLQGVRKPEGVMQPVSMREAYQSCKQSFKNVRVELRKSGRMASLVPLGLQSFYAQIHGLCVFAQKWCDLENLICEEPGLQKVLVTNIKEETPSESTKESEDAIDV